MGRLLALLIVSLPFLSSCEKKNPNYDPPPAFDGKAVNHHRFDGGESDPYTKPGAGGEGGESKGEH